MYIVDGFKGLCVGTNLLVAPRSCTAHCSIAEEFSLRIKRWELLRETEATAPKCFEKPWQETRRRSYCEFKAMAASKEISADAAVISEMQPFSY